VENAETAAPVIREFLERNGIADAAIEPVAPSMEDVFVEDMVNWEESVAGE
jgi:hypothetical protein